MDLEIFLWKIKKKLCSKKLMKCTTRYFANYIEMGKEGGRSYKIRANYNFCIIQKTD